MKDLSLILILFLNIQLHHSQADFTENENLATFGKVWGFLKYYHPNVAKGDFDWEAQLVNNIDTVKSLKDKDALSLFLINWIDTLGKIDPCKKCDNTDKEYFEKNFNLEWLQNEALFSVQLIEKLKYIERNRFQGNQHYVTDDRFGNIMVTNEENYSNMVFPDENYRILSVMRYWNLIEYFFPYKYMTDQKWDDVLKEILPKIRAIDTAEAYNLVLLELVVKLNDGHGYVQSQSNMAYFGKNFLPVTFKVIDEGAIVNRLLSDSLAQVNNLRLGDVITHFDYKAIADHINENRKYLSASNEAGLLKNLAYTIFRGDDSSKIRMLRDGKQFEQTIARYNYSQLSFDNNSGINWKFIEPTIGYVDMGNLEIKEVKSMFKDLAEAKAIIFDLRRGLHSNTYPLITNKLLESETPFVKSLVPDLTYPGKFYFKTPRVVGLTKNKNSYKGKVIILVNENMQSKSEFSTMALQTDENAITIGSQTSGADGDLSFTYFVGGIKTAFSGIGIFYPNGDETQRKGVKVDLIINTAIDDISNQVDTILEEAIRVARKQ